VQPEERDKETPQYNLERLKSHLKKDSLAEKLASAQIGAEGSDPRSALRKVVMDRIEGAEARI
jgi:hypothetical protein